MQPAMTQEQALMQMKQRRAQINRIMPLTQADRDAVKALMDAIRTSKTDLAQVLTEPVVEAYYATLSARLSIIELELEGCNNELKLFENVEAQIKSPILVPGRSGVMGGGGIKTF